MTRAENSNPENPVTHESHRVREWVIKGAVVAAVAVALGALWRLNPADLHIFPPCMFYWATGWYCPGCGGTRACHLLLHGQVLDALRYNAVLFGILGWFGYLGLRGLGVVPRPGDRTRWWAITGVLILLVLYTVLRNLPGQPWEYLRPPGP